MEVSMRHIEVFRALMTTGSVTAAAQLLYTSQPTVSRELARFEHLIGMNLFDRARGRLQPNAQALALYEEVQRSYVGLERVISTAARLKQFAMGQVSVICLPAFSHSLLPGACARFLAACPGVSIAITPQESPFLEEWLAAQTYDLGLTESDKQPAGTDVKRLLQIDEVAVLPDGHPLLAKSILEVDDFSGQRFISLSPSDPYRMIVDEMFRARGVGRQQIIETHSAVSVCSMVRKAIGISIVNPLTALDYVGKGLQIRPLAVSIPFKVNVVQPLHRAGNAAADRLIGFIQEEVTHLLQVLDEQLAGNRI